MTRSGIAFTGEGRRRAGKLRRGYRQAAVDPEYFETIGAQLVAGRFLAPEDRQGAPRVAVVSEGYAARNLDGAPALGNTVRGEECTPRCREDPMTVVGCVKEMAQEATDGERFPLVFEPMAQKHCYTQFATLLVRTSGELAPLQARVRDEVKALDAAQPEPSFSSLERMLEER